MNHILSGCSVALAQGRYTWRHNKVLNELAYWVEEQRRVNNKEPVRKRTWINFVKQGGKARPSTRTTESYMTTARDWKLQVDGKTRMKIPEYIVNTSLRPDMVLISEITKQIGVVELTVPTEDRIEISGEIKQTKYAELLESMKSNGWKARIWTVEVGCRGFAARSVLQFLKDIGYDGRKKKMIIKKIEEVAEQASHKIWNWSHAKAWGE